MARMGPAVGVAVAVAGMGASPVGGGEPGWGAPARVPPPRLAWIRSATGGVSEGCMDKEHILREIRRTADANGGVPLGFRKFEVVTGIKRSDWIGIYWPRWNDAIREAGLPTNQLQ